MNHNDTLKINRLHAKGWTANEIARAYGYRRSQVQRIILGQHRKSRAECVAAWREACFAARLHGNEGKTPDGVSVDTLLRAALRKAGA